MRTNTKTTSEQLSVVVGDTYAEQHTELRDALGDDYDEDLRLLVENYIHEVTQQVERSQESGSLAQTSSVGLSTTVSESVE